MSTMLQNVARSVRRTAVRTVVGGTILVGAVEVTTHVPSQGRSSALYGAVVDDWITPALRRLDPERAHELAVYSAKRGLAPQSPRLLSPAEQRVSLASSPFAASSSQLSFANPIGLAAGFDKHGEIIRPMLDLGFGWVEIGTVTARPQPGNPQPRMFRLTADRAIINRYGFNSVGAAAVAENLRSFRQQEEEQGEPQQQQPHQIIKQANDDNNNTNVTTTTAVKIWSWMQRLWYTLYPDHHHYSRSSSATGSAGSGCIVGVNIGKNKDTEDFDDVVQDYVTLVEQLGGYADYLVINVSSPNTAGLRDWQRGDRLEALLRACIRATQRHSNNDDQQPQQRRRRVPLLLVKVSPDQSDDELREIASVCLRTGTDGIIVSNTTATRPNDLLTVDRKLRSQPGGLSGPPLRDRSTSAIRTVYAATAGALPIIGVGGVASGRDAYEKLAAGACLVQVYTAMIYRGPCAAATKIRKELAEIMLENGQYRLEQVVGSDHADLFWKRQQERMIGGREDPTALGREKLILADQAM